MNEVYVPESTEVRSPALRSKPGLTTGLIALLFLVLLSSLAIYRHTPPAAVAADAPAAEFSSGRALKHLEVISRSPHAVGTTEHAAVRDYILGQLTALGVMPEVQKTTAVNKFGNNLRVATVENILVRLKGTGAGKALMLASHYDTVSVSPGASDDGSSVVAMLETLRALKAGAPLNNDVIFLFSDGEEIGLLGAKAFTEEHPWNKDVGLVLNFESRGATGPVIMFETSDGNGQLIREFAKAASHPAANSMAYEIYRLLPNSTDLTVFKGAQLPGLNFANTDGFTRYHARSDSTENLDERTLQHKGAYALALARRFGNLPLSGGMKDGNAVYFDLLGLTLLHYPAALAIPLTVLTAALFIVAAVIGLRRKRLTVGGIIAGLLAFVLTLFVAYVVASFIWWLVGAVQGRFARSMQDDVYQSNFYLISFVAVTLAVALALYNLFRKKIRAENLAFGALLCWLLLLSAVSVLIPGGSYLLTWPLLFALLSMLLMFRAGEQERVTPGRLVIMSLCAVPAIILMVPMIYQIYVALGIWMIAVVMILVALLFGVLMPYFALMTFPRKWLLPACASMVGLLFIGLAAFTLSFDRRHPRADNISYIQNTDLGKAVWASPDLRPDEWTAQFFRDNVERGSLAEYLPTGQTSFLKSPAPLVALPPADVRVLDDQTAGSVRTLRLSISSPYPAGYLMAPSDSNAEVLATTFNGKRFVNETPRGAPSGTFWSVNYYAPPPEGLELTLEVSAGRPLKLRTINQSYELPNIPGSPIKPRPEHLVPAPFTSGDTTQVSRSYTF